MIIRPNMSRVEYADIAATMTPILLASHGSAAFSRPPFVPKFLIICLLKVVVKFGIAKTLSCTLTLLWKSFPLAIPVRSTICSSTSSLSSSSCLLVQPPEYIIVDIVVGSTAS